MYLTFVVLPPLLFNFILFFSILLNFMWVLQQAEWMKKLGKLFLESLSSEREKS